jgi:hypothetical protein
MSGNQTSLPPRPGGFPWSGDQDSFVACNLAAGNLAHNLPRRLTREGRIHAETYVAAAGAIAGFAAQCSLLATADAATFANLHIVTPKSGNKYLFGDPLNDALLFARDVSDAEGRAWPKALGGAVAAGFGEARARAFDVGPLFAHVASTIGEANEGLPSVAAEHHPHLPARELLKVVWPMASQFFAADFDEFHRRFGPVPRKWWGAVAGSGASRPIVDVKDVLAPEIALTILMETAIYASKLDRTLIEQA